MSPITTHVLDTSLGRPAAGIPVTLSWEGEELGAGVTDADGRVRDLLPEGSPLRPGIYRLRFDLEGYFRGRSAFYPYAEIVFRLEAPEAHYHVPLLLNPFGYSTYRGS